MVIGFRKNALNQLDFFLAGNYLALGTIVDV
jgi:hypothetical protein